MIKIGYLNFPEESNYGFISSSVCNMEETQPRKVKGIDSNYVKMCPSVKTYYANTFEILCPFDLEFTVKFNDEGGWHTDINTDKTTISLVNAEFEPEKILNFTPDGRIVQIFPNPNWSFISDTKNVILIQHSNGIDTNPQILTGNLDIYKWPDRPLSVGYYLDKKEQTITLRRGQPWYRLTFITPEFEQVKLIRMYERCAFLKNTMSKGKLSLINKLNWKKIFNYFGNTRPKRLIKEN